MIRGENLRRAGLNAAGPARLCRGGRGRRGARRTILGMLAGAVSRDKIPITVSKSGAVTEGATYMSWECPRGKGRYYTRSRRVGGRIVREYFGTGPAAERAAAQDAERRAERLALAAEKRIQEDRSREAAALLDAYCQLTDQLLAAALTEAGYHQHDRGAWRRARKGPSKQPGPEQDPQDGAEGAPGTQQSA